MLYVFFRSDMFYPIDLRDDADACANAECNPGTTRVEDLHGRIVWGAIPATPAARPDAPQQGEGRHE